MYIIFYSPVYSIEHSFFVLSSFYINISVVLYLRIMSVFTIEPIKSRYKVPVLNNNQIKSKSKKKICSNNKKKKLCCLVTTSVFCKLYRYDKLHFHTIARISVAFMGDLGYPVISLIPTLIVIWNRGKHF